LTQINFRRKEFQFAGEGVMCNCNPSYSGVEARRTEIWDQPRVQSEILSQQNKTKSRDKNQ
jgi:hypothetical protein